MEQKKVLGSEHTGHFFRAYYFSWENYSKHVSFKSDFFLVGKLSSTFAEIKINDLKGFTEMVKKQISV